MTMSSPKIRVVRLTENAIIPTRGSTRTAGLDLYTAYDITVTARGSISVVTDLQIHVPEGYYGRIAPRSGLALHHHIDIGGGVIDEDYRGNVAVILFNRSDKQFVRMIKQNNCHITTIVFINHSSPNVYMMM